MVTAEVTAKRSACDKCGVEGQKTWYVDQKGQVDRNPAKWSLFCDPCIVANEDGLNGIFISPGNFKDIPAHQED